MRGSFVSAAFPGAVAVALLGCGRASNPPRTADANPVVATLYAASTLPSCATGGVALDAGVDVNANGVLDPAEVSVRQRLCNTTSGADSRNALGQLRAESQGTHCSAGRTTVALGVDANANGTLDAGEIVSRDDVCGTSGDPGQILTLSLEPKGTRCPDGGLQAQVGSYAPTLVCTLASAASSGKPPPSVVSVTPEPAGANCAYGGAKIQSGDSPPTYVCNGAPGAPGESVTMTSEPAGANCASGGVRLQVGSGTPSYVCNGAAGADGQSVTVTSEPEGLNCAAGGARLQVGSSPPAYVCNGAPGQSVTMTSEPAGVNCAAGGVRLQVGGGAASYVCNGAAGEAGSAGQSVTVVIEPIGANCATGGVKLQVGAGAPTYVCNGATGPAGQSISVTPESAGANCAAGGVKLQVGAGPASYVCSGTPGAAGQSVITTPEAAGANCTYGGVKLQVGTDAPRYACNGAPGADGQGVTTTPEPAGANCTYGGVKLQAGSGAPTYVCNGSVGLTGLVRTIAEPGGANCPYGGTRVEVGLDANANGALDDSEVNQAGTSFVCNPGLMGAVGPSTGIHLTFKSVTTAVGAPVSVRFTVKDDRGFPIDLAGRYSVNTPIQPRFALASYSTEPTTGIVSPLWVYTRASSDLPSQYSPFTAADQGTVVENGYGAGDYTYTFPTVSTPNGAVGVSYDPSRLDQAHVVWLQATRQTDLVFTANANTFSAANEPYVFVPSGGASPAPREIASTERCWACHDGFRPETTSSMAFHGGGRVDAGMCNVCHNPARTTNPLANSASFVHRIHAGRSIAPANQFHGIAATYPQDIRRCDACHGGAAQGAQALTNPSAIACSGCHDYVSFTGSTEATCGVSGALALGADGLPVPCNHAGGPRTDAECAGCHGPNAGFPTARYHVPVVPPDPNNVWRTGGMNANTNAAWVAAGGVVPAGAAVITYEVKSVDAVVDTSVTPNVMRPQITFKLKRDGVDVVFQSFAAGAVTEMIPDFAGSPSVYFAFAVPQDGIASPADFNASASGYLRSIWNGTATGTGGGTIYGPDASGFYTVRLTGVRIPDTATMLTGGIGYTYSLSSTPPLVQTNVPGYPWIPNVPADGKAQGGLIVPAANVWKVATGFTGRRAIVETAKCNACHGALGVAPSFHVGQRNDAPTCSFCHNPNRSSSGWSAAAKYFVHAIHGGRMRWTAYTWHALAPGLGYGEVSYPAPLNDCTSCHAPGTYDFTNSVSLRELADATPVTAATGTFNSDPLVNSMWFTVSPYVTADGLTNYGTGFSFNAATGVTTQAASTNLVISPFTATCVSCHDSPIAIDHMRSSGGAFYEPRANVLSAYGGAGAEQCLLCHGPGRVAAIGEVHLK